MKEKNEDDGNYELLSPYNFVAVASIIIVVSLLYYVAINMDTLKTIGLEFYDWLNNQSPFLAGAIGVWVLGVATYLARGIPNKIWDFTVKQLTVELTLNNIDDVYGDFLQWYHKTGRSSHARTLIAKNKDYRHVDVEAGEFHDMEVSAGYGIHYFIYGGQVFQINRTEKDASNIKDVKESMVITTIGRSQRQFHNLLNAISPEKKYGDVTEIYKWCGDYWRKYGTQASRKFDSVILPQETRDAIVNHIQTFLDERSWYIEHGIPYRTGMILHGIPGTGKTSLARALCDKFDKPLYILSLNGISDNSLEEAFAELPRDTLVLIEDIDTYAVAATRKPSNNKTSNQGEPTVRGGSKISMYEEDDPIDNNMMLSMLTLGGLLNSIDGVVASDGRILIATTNHVNRLDAALTRKGRFNISVEIGYLKHDCIIKFFDSFYPGFKVPTDVKFRTEITPADLQASIMDNIENPEPVLNFVLERDEH